jgi:pimeloyl-ACP methyl ester carboxylesterase
LERPECKLSYEVTGSGPAIVFAHGLGGNHMSWWQQVAHFAPRFTCVTFAHRGFAPSSSLPGGPDPADYAGDLAALAAHLGIADDMRVVAQSMGGWTAVEYTLQRPAGLKGVVLAATTGSIDPQRLPAAYAPELAAWTEHAAKVRAEMAQRGIHPAAGIRMAEQQPALHLLYRHIDDMNAALDKEALRARLFAGRVRAPEALRDVACPVLMIGNDEDSVMPPMAAEGIASVVPQVRAVRIPAAAHSAYFERADLFNAIVDEFLARLEPA